MAVTPRKVENLSTTQLPVFLPSGKAQTVIRTKWMYGPDHGPYTTDIPIESFTASALAQAQKVITQQIDLLP